ncbi:hypothetical protein [Parapedobacter indicus]|uniref:Uncharacterized protein n=1 Tax=Parapedobacter indicus TaxID=1477437 RepID=A0A1I3E3R6_9SPHI|nr:hypothetical protein [Parapedobacter indicus]PPL04956.1 hypothetical protein CLV26_101767 [Parapedobacter indicus]SFH93624.1 hypothetical protein SAMN05444682_101753 [Parapedobacter indicus]
MTKAQLLEYLTERAASYRKGCEASIKPNAHMNDVVPADAIEQRVIDAILVDFVNHIGMHQGIDYALYTKDFVNT